MNTASRPLARLSALLALVVLSLTGCAASAPQEEKDPAIAASETVMFDDAWIKAADDGMSAAFGTLMNNGEADITVVSAQTEAAEMVELHETVEIEAGETIMREIDGGFVVPAGGALPLEPGGSHIMLMGLTGPLAAGDDVTIILTFSDESSIDFTLPVKDYSGANEKYEDDHEHEDNAS